MYWAALLSPKTPRAEAVLRQLAIWALQFTPRVACFHDAVLLELAGSLKLFGGPAAVRARIASQAQHLGAVQVSWAPTSVGAAGLARAGVEDGFAAPWADVLDGLGLQALLAVSVHAPVLARLGCKTLRDVRLLPRGGLTRRLGPGVLAELDQAYGLRPCAHQWIELPPTFDERLELPWRVDRAPALLDGARHLLVVLEAWLSARQSGITAITLRWAHDAMRASSAGTGGELRVRTGVLTRDIDHLARLLQEHLHQVKLAAPVSELQLVADEVQPLPQASATLLAGDPGRHVGNLDQTLERLAARLGPARVCRVRLEADYRLERMQRWEPAGALQATRDVDIRLGTPLGAMPQPTWLVQPPLRLATRDDRPLYQGRLELVLGPHRVESGWWDCAADALAPQALAAAQDGPTSHVQRDYWVAISQYAGVLWIYHERWAAQTPEWYLHGIFA